MTAAAVYNYNETSEVIPYEINPTSISGFRNIVDKDFIIGGLFPVYDCSQDSEVADVEMLEAMLFAIDRINNDMNLLPNLTIGYDVRDTCNHTGIGLYETYDFILEYITPSDNSTPVFLGIVGPAYTIVTHSVAILLGYYQTPVISYATSDAALSNKDLYKYFLRTIPSDNLQVNAMVDLMSYFGWQYVSVIFNDNLRVSTFIDVAGQHKICLDTKIYIPPSAGAEFNQTVVKAARTLLNSTASVVVVFADEGTVLALFEELIIINKTSTKKFVWIASDKWANSCLIHEKFPEIANRTFDFWLHTKHIKEFADYFSQLSPSENIRDHFFPEYYESYCNETGADCSDGLTRYLQNDTIPFVIDAVYAFAHVTQNFLDNNCDTPLKWNRTTNQCNGMKHKLTSTNLFEYLHNVTFNSIQNYTMSFDENGDPSGVYEINNLQINENREYEYVQVGFWNSAYKENALMLTNIDGIVEVVSLCSEPCNDGMIRSITNQNCPVCFECIPCVGPTYSTNSSNIQCNTCPNNHWGNNPLSGSTHCVPVKVRHLDFSSGWSIVSMCIATIALLILAAIIVIFIINWNTPVVKSSGREQMILLLFAVVICCGLTYVVVAPPSITVCVFQRIGVWLCLSLAFSALLLKIVRIAKTFYSIESSAKKPSFIDSKYQIISTMAIVFVQLILVVIGLIIDPPIVKRDPDVVNTSSTLETGNAPEIIETCQQSHTAILVLSLVYNSVIIAGCIILGWMTRRFPGNFNEAERVMFTSFTLMVVWILFVPLYLNTKLELQMGVLALGIVLSSVALMAGIFFPRVYIIIFQRHKNTREYVSRQNYQYTAGTMKSTNSPVAFHQSKKPNVTWYRYYIIKPWYYIAYIDMSTDQAIKPVVKEDDMICA